MYRTNRIRRFLKEAAIVGGLSAVVVLMAASLLFMLIAADIINHEHPVFLLGNALRLEEPISGTPQDSTEPAATPTPEPAESNPFYLSPAAQQELEGCDVRAAIGLLEQGLWEGSKDDYHYVPGSNRWENWAMFSLDARLANGYLPAYIPSQDPNGHTFMFNVAARDLGEVRGDKMIFFNMNGQFATYQHGMLTFDEPWYCHEDAHAFNWANRSEYVALMDFNYYKGTKGFISTFYVGHALTEDEMNSLFSYAAEGLIPDYTAPDQMGGNFGEQAFEVDRMGDLLWRTGKFVGNDGQIVKAVIDITDSPRLPMNTELLVETQYVPSGAIRWQRVVLTVVDGEVRMYQPTPDWSGPSM